MNREIKHMYYHVHYRRTTCVTAYWCH